MHRAAILTWALRSIDWGQYKLVGFTSTFDQNVASLNHGGWDPSGGLIVFGGAN